MIEKHTKLGKTSYWVVTQAVPHFNSHTVQIGVKAELKTQLELLIERYIKLKTELRGLSSQAQLSHKELTGLEDQVQMVEQQLASLHSNLKSFDSPSNNAGSAKATTS